MKEFYFEYREIWNGFLPFPLDMFVLILLLLWFALGVVAMFRYRPGTTFAEMNSFGRFRYLDFHGKLMSVISLMMLLSALTVIFVGVNSAIKDETLDAENKNKVD
jgi:uncharacterized RDD family membrane protein YckC